MENSTEEREKWKILRELGADKLWQPTLDEIVNTYGEFTKGASKCNTVLLVTERNYFHEFYMYFLKPAFPEEAVYFANIVSGYWFKKHIHKIKQEIMFLQDEINWLASKFAPKAQRIKSLRELLQTAKENRKFLILCGYDFDLRRFKERLSLAYVREPPPEVKEFRLEPLP